MHRLTVMAVLASMVYLLDPVDCHGFLAVPVNRASMWRVGYDTPKDYDDNQLYCGGKSVQWQSNGGKCGECGDNYADPRPRAHENTGPFGLGISVETQEAGWGILGLPIHERHPAIVHLSVHLENGQRVYFTAQRAKRVVDRDVPYSSGATIQATANITANHRGYFEFRLCPLASKSELETQDCFDSNLLTVQGGSDTRYYLPNGRPGLFDLTVTLPRVTCELCVLQWTYTAANSWGACSNGTEATGCGPQETFRTCSDITIV